MLPELPSDAGILVIDDMESNVSLMRAVFGRAGCSEVAGLTDPRQALDFIRARQPDLVVLDLHMPYMTGIEVLEALLADPDRDPYLAVLVLTGDASDTARHEALAKGASDFLTKPFDAIEAVFRARNLLETRRLHLAQRDQNVILERRVRERTLDLELAQLEILDRLALAGDFRDDVTGSHARRVGKLAGMVAEAFGLPDDQRELLQLAAPLHDIGKIGIHDAVLLKPGKLTPEEFEHIKTHIHTGAELLSGSRFPILQMGCEIALMHHERWDGRGYLGVSGDDIPLAARIVSIADVFDALTHVRPYKEAWPIPEALAEIEQLRERAFDPNVVDAFLTLGLEQWTSERLDSLGAARRQLRQAA